jgi:hypothetical protein
VGGAITVAGGAAGAGGVPKQGPWQPGVTTTSQQQSEQPHPHPGPFGKQQQPPTSPRRTSAEKAAERVRRMRVPLFRQAPNGRASCNRPTSMGVERPRQANARRPILRHKTGRGKSDRSTKKAHGCGPVGLIAVEGMCNPSGLGRTDCQSGRTDWQSVLQTAFQP